MNQFSVFMNRILRIVLASLVVLLFLPSQTTRAEEECSEEKLRDLGVAIVSCSGELSCGPGGSGLPADSKLYFIGDSLTYGMVTIGNLLDQAETAGYEVNADYDTTSNPTAVRGESVQAVEGYSVSSMVPVVEENADDYAENRASTIVIGLGTNSEPNLVESITAMIDTIRSVNKSAKIYWINTYFKPTEDSYKDINSRIEEAKQLRPGEFTIIDFASEMEAKEAIEASGGSENNIGLAGDLIHHGGSEYTKRAEYVLRRLGATSSASISTSQAGVTSGTASGPVTLENEGGGSYTLDAGWQPIIAAAAERFQVDPYILVGILRVETAWPNSTTVETERIRNSATATGPFQILDLALQDISDRPDSDYSRSETPSARVINRVGGTGSALEPDGTPILDGDKDGEVDRHSPYDAAFMSAAYVNLLGGEPGIPIGSKGEPIGTANDEIDAGTNTVAKVLAHYNQGGGWNSNRAVQGNNNVEHYIVNGIAGYEAVRAAGWFGPGSATGSCAGLGSLVTGDYVWPVTSGGRVSACWSDLRNKTVSGGSYYHSGVDIAAGEGEEVVALTAGNVRFAGEHSSYGNLVIVEHTSDGLFSHYGHLTSIDVEEGQSIQQGEKVGGVGNTGVSLGNHLHLNLYDTWPFGPLPGGAANANGSETLNPLTHGLMVPGDVEDTPGCVDYPEGGREVDIAL